jgi:hypothetical protein
MYFSQQRFVSGARSLQKHLLLRFGQVNRRIEDFDNSHTLPIVAENGIMRRLPRAHIFIKAEFEAEKAQNRSNFI